MPNPPKFSSEQLSEIIAQAMRRIDSHPGTSAVDEEHLVLFASGRLDRVPESMRGPLLRAVATNPALGQLIAELHELRLDEGAVRIEQAHGSPNVIARIGPRVGAPLGVTWLVAACMLFGIGLWRFGDPPAPLNPDGSVSMMQMEQTPGPSQDYWQELDDQRRIERAHRDQYRDYALVATATATLILSIPVAWLVLRPRRRTATS
jgi:hypothetical protein